MVTMVRSKAGSETKEPCRVEQQQVGEKVKCKRGGALVRDLTSLVGGSERSVERRRETMVTAVGKGHGVDVGLQFKRTLPSALIAPSVLYAVLCAQGLSIRTGLAGLKLAWQGKTVMAATCNFRVPDWR